MWSALLIATVVVPIYTALLHAWIYAHRRRASAHLWLAISALGAGGIAIAVLGRTAAPTTDAAVAWQRWQMFGGAVLTVGFVRWAHAALRLERPRLERAVDVFVALDCLGLARGAIFSDEVVLRPALGRPGVVPEAVLSPLGIAVVAVFGGLVLYVGFELGRAARRRAEPRLLFAAYCLFAAALFHDLAVGVNLVNGSQLLPRRLSGDDLGTLRRAGASLRTLDGRGRAARDGPALARRGAQRRAAPQGTPARPRRAARRARHARCGRRPRDQRPDGVRLVEPESRRGDLEPSERAARRAGDPRRVPRRTRSTARNGRRAAAPRAPQRIGDGAGGSRRGGLLGAAAGARRGTLPRPLDRVPDRRARRARRPGPARAGRAAAPAERHPLDSRGRRRRSTASRCRPAARAAAYGCACATAGRPSPTPNSPTSSTRSRRSPPRARRRGSGSPSPTRS